MTTMFNDRRHTNWTALATIMTVFVQLIALVWWTAKLDARIYTLECWMRDAKPAVDQISAMRQTDESVLKGIVEIKTSLSGLSDRLWQVHDGAKK